MKKWFVCFAIVLGLGLLGLSKENREMVYNFAAILGFIKIKPEPKHLEWTEEVKLSNGKVIKIKRVSSWTPHTQYGYRQNIVEVLDTGELGETLPIWQDKWKPIILDKGDDGLWFMVVYPERCDEWNSFYNFRQYKVINDKWQQVEFEIDKLNNRRANLEWEIKWDGTFPKELTLVQKPLNPKPDKYELENILITPYSRNYCGETPCYYDEQGRLECGWGGKFCPIPEGGFKGNKDEPSSKEFEDWRKCILDYKKDVFTPKWWENPTEKFPFYY